MVRFWRMGRIGLLKLSSRASSAARWQNAAKPEFRVSQVGRQQQPPPPCSRPRALLPYMETHLQIWQGDNGDVRGPARKKTPPLPLTNIDTHKQRVRRGMWHLPGPTHPAPGRKGDCPAPHSSKMHVQLKAALPDFVKLCKKKGLSSFSPQTVPLSHTH